MTQSLQIFWVAGLTESADAVQNPMKKLSEQALLVQFMIT